MMWRRRCSSQIGRGRVSCPGKVERIIPIELERPRERGILTSQSLHSYKRQILDLIYNDPERSEPRVIYRKRILTPPHLRKHDSFTLLSRSARFFFSGGPLSKYFISPAYVLPTPQATFASIIEDWPNLWSGFIVTGQVFLYGFVIRVSLRLRVGGSHGKLQIAQPSSLPNHLITSIRQSTTHRDRGRLGYLAGIRNRAKAGHRGTCGVLPSLGECA